MSAAVRNKRLTIQSATVGTANSYGETPATWADVTTVWASVITLSGNEAWKAAQINAKATVRVTMLANDSLTKSTQWRFAVGSRYLYPVNVVEKSKEREWMFLCSEDV